REHLLVQNPFTGTGPVVVAAPGEAVGFDIGEYPADGRAVRLGTLLEDVVAVGPPDEAADVAPRRREPHDIPHVRPGVVQPDGGTGALAELQGVLHGAAGQYPAEMPVSGVLSPLAGLRVDETVVDVPGADEPAVQIESVGVLRIGAGRGQQPEHRGVAP